MENETVIAHLVKSEQSGFQAMNKDSSSNIAKIYIKNSKHFDIFQLLKDLKLGKFKFMCMT